MKEGTPFFLGSDVRPAEPLCSFFFEMARTLKAKSLADYTYDALTWSTSWRIWRSRLIFCRD